MYYVVTNTSLIKFLKILKLFFLYYIPISILYSISSVDIQNQCSTADQLYAIISFSPSVCVMCIQSICACAYSKKGNIGDIFKI